MNAGGDPERDDYGLPPVDIEVPDDARELDRDVLAYHRELRAQRRRTRTRRVFAPFTRHGMVLPLVAGCMALSMLAGALLSVFAIGPAAAPVVSPAPVPTFKPEPTPSVGQIGGQLPAGTVLVSGRPMQLRDLRPAVLAIVPSGCRCATALRQLTTQAAAVLIQVYFVGTDAAMPQVNQLTAQDGQGEALAVDDPGNILGATYHPAGLTAILVHTDAAVEAVRPNLAPGFQLGDRLSKLDIPGLGDSGAVGPATGGTPPSGS